MENSLTADMTVPVEKLMHLYKANYNRKLKKAEKLDNDLDSYYAWAPAWRDNQDLIYTE